MNKKAVSIMIGYVLLITAAIVMSFVIYQWLRTYVPSQGLECPDDVSVFIKDYECGGGQINVTLKNNGRFSLAGYFVHVSNKTGEEIATRDISSYIKSGGISAGNTVVFVTKSDNSLKPNEEIKSSFELTDITGPLYLIEIIPARYQRFENKMRFISCGGSKISERLTCSLA